MQDEVPQLAALNGRPCRLFFNSAAMASVATPGRSTGASHSRSDQLSAPRPSAATTGEKPSCSMMRKLENLQHGHAALGACPALHSRLLLFRN